MGGGQTTGTSSPWGPAQPYLQGALSGAQNTYNAQGPYPSLSPTTQGALDLTANRALTGSPLVQTAQNTVQNMAAGGQSNPYLDQMFNTAANRTRDYTMGAFTSAGRTGSGANQQELTRNIGELANNFYGGQYNQDQNRTLAAAELAPGLANQDYTDLHALLGTGQLQDQQNLNAYNQPWSNLTNFANIIGAAGGRGGSTTSTAPSQSIIPSLLGSYLTGNSGGLGGIFGGDGGGNLGGIFSSGGIMGNQGVGGLGSLLGTTGGVYDGGLGGASFAGDYGGSGLLGGIGDAASWFGGLF